MEAVTSCRSRLLCCVMISMHGSGNLTSNWKKHGKSFQMLCVWRFPKVVLVPKNHPKPIKIGYQWENQRFGVAIF